MTSDQSRSLKQFVVGVTTEPTAQQAAHSALDLARAVGAEVHFVTAVDDNEREVVGIGSDVIEVDTLGAAEAEVRALIGATGTEVPYTVTAVVGDPGKALVKEAERLEADLIVVGNARMQGIGRLLGSVGNHVVHHAPCSVHIVKTT